MASTAAAEVSSVEATKKKNKATGAHQRAFSRVTVATFRAMKHDPMGGGADRRWRDITDISSPPTSQCLTEVPYEGLHMPIIYEFVNESIKNLANKAID